MSVARRVRQAACFLAAAAMTSASVTTIAMPAGAFTSQGSGPAWCAAYGGKNLASYDNVYACGLASSGRDAGKTPFDSAPGFQCTELADRYFYDATGHNLMENEVGGNFVALAASKYSIAASSSATKGSLPAAGDIISMWGGTSGEPQDGGDTHVAVVTRVTTTASGCAARTAARAGPVPRSTRRRPTTTWHAPTRASASSAVPTGRSPIPRTGGGLHRDLDLCRRHAGPGGGHHHRRRALVHPDDLGIPRVRRMPRAHHRETGVLPLPGQAAPRPGGGRDTLTRWLAPPRAEPASGAISPAVPPDPQASPEATAAHLGPTVTSPPAPPSMPSSPPGRNSDGTAAQVRTRLAVRRRSTARTRAGAGAAGAGRVPRSACSPARSR
jgi:hypothetical protein